MPEKTSHITPNAATSAIDYATPSGISQNDYLAYLSNLLIGKITPETKIYKYFPLKYLCSLIGGKLLLNPITSWDDVYENIFFKQNFKTNFQGGRAEVLVDGVRESFYGQSWTILPESDAMWRIYSHEERNGSFSAVRLTTTVKKLFDAALQHRHIAMPYIGEVRYLTQSELENMLDEIARVGYTVVDTILPIEMALTKREPFSHEKEVRLIMWKDYHENAAPPESISIDVDFNSLIEEITFDPRCSDKAYQKGEKKLRKKGVNIPITKSRLYTSPAPRTITIK